MAKGSPKIGNPKEESTAYCEDPDHIGSRIITGDIWLSYPDFIYRCTDCEERKQKSNGKETKK